MLFKEGRLLVDKKTRKLFNYILNYKEGKGSYDAIIEFIRNNYKKYDIWDNHPLTKADFDGKNRKFVLDSLVKLEKELVYECIDWSCLFVKSDNNNGILIHYATHRLFIVSSSSIETYVFIIKYDEE